MKIPLLRSPGSGRGNRAEVRAAIERVLESQQFILGAAVESFEREMAEFSGAEDAVGVASGPTRSTLPSRRSASVRVRR